MDNGYFINGAIIVSRYIFNEPIFANPNLLKVWIYCLSKANYKDKWVTLKVGKGYTEVFCKRGQFIYGRNKAAETLNVSSTSTKTLIDKLEKYKYIKIEPNNQYSIITILNYNEIQDLNNYEVTTNTQPIHNQYTTNNTTKNKNIDIYTEDSINNSKKNNETISDEINSKNNEIEILKKQIETLTKKPKQIPKNRNTVEQSKSFYENEIKNLNNLIHVNGEAKKIETYKIFVDFLLGNNNDKKPMAGILSIPKQLTFKSFCDLMITAEQKKIKLANKLYALENDQKYYKTKQSLFATINNWISDKSNIKTTYN